MTVRTRRAPTALATALVLLAPPALAQQSAPALPEDPRAPRFAEVERGAFAGFEAGGIVLFRTPVADPAKYPFAGSGGGSATGLLAGVHVGYDVTPRLAVSLLALGANAQASASYGAFDLAGGGADVRWAFAGRSDRNGVERLLFYVHGRGAWLATRPSGLFGTSDFLVGGGPGVEYFTRLRHFSVGLAADLLYLTRASTAGMSIAPTVRYTF